MYFTCSLQGQEMKHMSVLCNIWPIWPDLRNRLTLKLILITENTDQMLTWHVLGVVNHSLQFDFMNKLRILVDFNSWCELGRVAILEFCRFFIINKTVTQFSHTYIHGMHLVVQRLVDKCWWNMNF